MGAVELDHVKPARLQKRAAFAKASIASSIISSFISTTCRPSQLVRAVGLSVGYCLVDSIRRDGQAGCSRSPHKTLRRAPRMPDRGHPAHHR